MTAHLPPVPPAPPQPVSPWKKRAWIALGIVVVLVGGFFFAIQVLPRWWGSRMAALVDGSRGAGIAWGLAFGLVCTVLTVLVLRLALVKRDWAWKPRWALVVLAIVLACPVLMTSGIAWGGGSGAETGARRMDAGAPGLRGATLIGFILGLALAVVIEVAIRMGREDAVAKRRARQGH